MESTDLHHLQDQTPYLNTSSLSTPPCYGIGSTRSWSPQISLNAGNPNQILQEAGSRSNQWASEAENCLSSTQCSGHDLDLHFSIKKEDMYHNFTRFTDMPINSMEQHYELQRDHLNGLREKLLLNTLSSSDFYYNSTSFGGLGAPSRGNFSQIYPTINISNLNNSSSTISSSPNINMHSSYPLSSATLSGHSGLSLHMQHSSHQPLFTNGMVETKRPSALMESKPSQSQTASKKLRPEPRSSCPPLKVRKEKLGDRIAALQQLVAPFGKTDTASVLMEAIGYIKFLQNQVETLSVPYMQSSRNQHSRSVMQGGSGKDGAEETPKRDLRSRGLCLVPLSCMSYLAADHPPPSMWHPP